MYCYEFYTKVSFPSYQRSGSGFHSVISLFVCDGAAAWRGCRATSYH